MNDQERLSHYVEVWWSSINDLLALLEQLDDDDWSTPTDLAGWDVRAVVSHIAHLESILAGGPEETAEVGEPSHVSGFMGLYTEIGVVNRRTTSNSELIEEIRVAANTRHQALTTNPPVDASAHPTHAFGGVPWGWGTLLRNRPLDVWMHEQDIRRATNRPGNLDTPGAQHSTDYLIESFGYVIAKRVAAPVGTSAVLEVEGSPVAAFTVNDAKRGEQLADLPESPHVRLRMRRESFLLLAGGRRPVEAGAVVVEGDQTLGEQLVSALATTP